MCLSMCRHSLLMQHLHLQAASADLSPAHEPMAVDASSACNLGFAEHHAHMQGSGSASGPGEQA